MIKASRKSLLAALSIAAPVASRRHDNTILENVLISGLSVTATDTNILVRQDFAGSGSITTLAPASILKSMLSTMTDDEVTLAVEGGNLLVSGDHTQHRFATANAKDFPQPPTPEWKSSCVASGPQFTTLVRAVASHAEDIDSKYAIGSVLIEFNERSIAIVALDGNAVGVAQFDAAPSAVCTVLVPKASTRYLAHKTEGQMRISLSDNWLAADSGSGRVMVRLAEGRFMAWRKAIPSSKHAFSTSIIPSVLSSCIRRTCVAPPDAEFGPRIKLTSKDGSLTVRCKSGSFDSQSSIPCATEGEMAETLNWRYLIESLSGLQAVSDEPAELLSYGSDEAISLKRGELTFVVMPIAAAAVKE